MGLFTPAEFKIGRRFHWGQDDIIEITGRKQDGSYTYSIVDPKTGYLKKGFGGTIAAPQKQRIMKDNPENPMVQIIDEEAERERDMADDPNDDITSVNEYNQATVEKGDEPVTPFEEDAEPINKKLATAGTVVKAVGKVAIVAGTVGMMTAGFLLGPFIALGIAFAGMGSFLGLDFLGDRMRKKAGVIMKKVYMN